MIVLIKTGRDKFNSTKNLYERGTGMSAEATERLIDKDIKEMEIDSWGWDLPLPYMLKKAKESGNSELFWEAHLVVRDREYCHMEQLATLDVPPHEGIKTVGASANHKALNQLL